MREANNVKKKLWIWRSVGLFLFVPGGVAFIYGWLLGNDYRKCIQGTKYRPSDVCNTEEWDRYERYTGYGWPLFVVGGLLVGYGEKQWPSEGGGAPDETHLSNP